MDAREGSLSYCRMIVAHWRRVWPPWREILEVDYVRSASIIGPSQTLFDSSEKGQERKFFTWSLSAGISAILRPIGGVEWSADWLLFSLPT